MKLATIAIALVGRNALVSAQQSLNTLFNVDQTTCGNRIADLEQFLNDAAEMSFAALDTYNAAIFESPPSKSAQAYLYGLMILSLEQQNEDQTVLHRLILQRTYDFIWAGVQPGPIKATLFCDDSFLARRYPGDDAVQQDGSTVMDVSGNPLSIADVYSERIIAATINDNPPLIASLCLSFSCRFFAAAVRRYMFLPYYQNPAFPICAGRVVGSTILPRQPTDTPFMVLCPKSFTEGEQRVLGTINSVPSAAGTFSEDPQSLRSIEPSSLTFLHEMFHFAPYRGPSNIPTNDDAGYGMLSVLGATTVQAVLNADSYAYFGLGAWYTYYRPAPDPNNPQNVVDISFATGYCRYLQDVAP